MIRQESLSSTRQTLATIGYDLEAGFFQFDQGTDRETQLFRVSRIEGPSITTLGLMLVTPALVEVWRHREMVRAFGAEIKVVTKDALIKMKQLAGRHQDLADIEALQSISRNES